MPRSLTNWSGQLYSTFSGSDILVSVSVPVLANDSTATNFYQNQTWSTRAVSVGNLQTISISSHRDSVPVRACKSVNPRGFTRGPRTIAGSLIFSMFDEYSLRAVSDEVRAYYQVANANYAAQTGNVANPNLIPQLLPDELPPFDVTITMANEYGAASHAKVLGMQIITNGTIAGIDDLYIEEQMSYIALAYIPVVQAGFGQVNPVQIS